jgi:acyl-CoA hydrolase
MNEIGYCRPMIAVSSSISKTSASGAVDYTERVAEPSAEVHLDEWIAPELVDDNGLLRVGRILEWMDVGGALTAARFCRRACVTASVNGVEMFRPIEVGEHVSMTARIAHSARRSVGVHVSLRARGHKLLADSEALSAYMTFVPVTEQGEMCEVRRFEPTTPRDRALFREGELRREFRQKLAAGDLSESPLDGAATRQRMTLRSLARDVRRIVPFVADPSAPNRRSPETSYVHRIEPVMGGSLNIHGTLYGGTLMRWIENAASLSARAFADAAMIVQAVHGLDFLRPVHNNVFLHTHAMAVRADKATVTIRVEVTSEDPLTGAAEPCLHGYFTYHPLDRRLLLPELEVSSDVEHALCTEASHQLAFSRRLREQQ